MKVRGPLELARGWVNAPMVFAFVFFASLPMWIGAVGLYSYLGLEVLIWIIFALGYNLLLGYTGLPSFGHGAFLGIGGYCMGWAQHEVSQNIWIGLLGATLTAALIGAAVALFISHRRGIYYALLTIALGQMLFFIANKWTSVTGGEDGMLNIARLPASFGVVSFSLQTNEALYYFVLGIFIVVTVLLWRVVNSPFGKIIKAIKQNEERVRYLGYNVYLYKLATFTLSCGLAGLAGGAAKCLLPGHDIAMVGYCGADDGDRRRFRELLGAGCRHCGVFRGPRRARDIHRNLAALVRADVHGDHHVQAGRHRRYLAGFSTVAEAEEVRR
jgi:ABC-type branched-subunit amino acid transport system permease subunit